MLRKAQALILVMFAFMAACSDMGKEVVEIDHNPQDTTISFMNDLQPIFNSHCVGCHVGNSQGGLNLETYANLMAGSDSGIVVVPFFPDSSRIIKRLEGIIQPRMPFQSPPLNQNQIDLIRQWIAEGAEDN